MIALLTTLSALAAPFPVVRAPTVAGPDLELPAALPRGGIIAVAFARAQADDLASWETALEAAGVEHASLLVMGDAGGLLRGTIALAMRATLPTRRQAHTALAWGDATALLSGLGEPDRARLLVVQVDGAGEVIGKTGGAWTAESGAALGVAP